MESVKLKVEGMSCDHCVRAVEGAVKEAGGSAKVDLASKTVTVDYEQGKVTLQAIKDAIEDQGYDVV
ncbi:MULTISPECIES: copper ion binding protein [Paenibacillus]|uniref:copper ion binding protein n=1 Tax=Paenibacillus TaxID=44249 RepID=UPI0022B8D08A|nr:copper ion binding protein [Paenibacillus caseinilyticus]MCZ8523960.1 copper ion binding protein [Paenibacillus caseinilyticus]